MLLFKNGIDLFKNLSNFIEASEKLNIYVPYIKLETLKAIIDNCNNIDSIIVRWETRDLITGGSDLEIYPYLKQKGITLYRNPRLHLKAYIDNYQKAFIGSANISMRALNQPETYNYNYELATEIENLSLDDRLYFNCIESGSILITDNIYEQFKTQLPEKIKSFPNETDFSIQIEYPDKDFLISSLPLTYSVETLFRIYETKTSINEVELNCAMHDLANYNIQFGLTLEQFTKELKAKFFNHAFIRAFLENLEKANEIYFGEAKEWIHKNCSNVPLPMKWEITKNIQILYRWIVKLSDGLYQIDRPNYSERLFLK